MDFDELFQVLKDHTKGKYGEYFKFWRWSQFATTLFFDNDQNSILLDGALPQFKQAVLTIGEIYNGLVIQITDAGLIIHCTVTGLNKNNITLLISWPAEPGSDIDSENSILNHLDNKTKDILANLKNKT